MKWTVTRPTTPGYWWFRTLSAYPGLTGKHWKCLLNIQYRGQFPLREKKLYVVDPRPGVTELPLEEWDSMQNGEWSDSPVAEPEE